MLQSFKRGRKKESVYRARLTSKLRAKKNIFYEILKFITWD